MDLGIPRLGGQVHPAYANPRPEVTAVIPRDARRVLDVGCSVGAMGAALMERGHEVTGIEVEPELAEHARRRLGRVIEGDVEEMARAGKDPGGPFDCICFADVLEHLRDPWSVVRWADDLLSAGGVVVASIPNVAHVQTLWTLTVRRVWPYKDVGIFDRTHIRFFARRNLPDLFAGTSLRIRETHRVPMVSLDNNSRWNRFARYLGDFGTLQFIVLAARADDRGRRPPRGDA